jgi:hypothetical protein
MVMLSLIRVGRSDLDRNFIKSAFGRSRLEFGFQTQHRTGFVFCDRGKVRLIERLRSSFLSKGLIRLRDQGRRLAA